MMRIGVTALIDAEPDLVVCCQANDAAMALSEMARQAPDLVITDLTLPGKGGLELIKDIRAGYPDLPVLVISMHDELMHAERCLRAGARGYLMKEAGGAKMLEAIRKVLTGQVYVSETIAGRILDMMSGAKPRGSSSPIEKLSDREFEIFQLIGQGKNARQIALLLHISPKTVDVHRARIKEKLGLEDATSLVHHAARWVGLQEDRAE